MRSQSTVAERFWCKVDRSGECWPWTAAVRKREQGYGVFWLRGRNEPSHRIAWELTHGPIPDGLLVCHRCDNPPCCRPDHLFLGTNLDNMRDRGEKGRYSSGDQHWTHLHPERLARGERHVSRTHPELLPRGDKHHSRTKPETILRGEAHPQARLTADQVRELRRIHAAGEASYSQLVKRFGVCKRNVARIIKRRIWKEVA